MIEEASGGMRKVPKCQQPQVERGKLRFSRGEDEGLWLAYIAECGESPDRIGFGQGRVVAQVDDGAADALGPVARRAVDVQIRAGALVERDAGIEGVGQTGQGRQVCWQLLR